MATDSDSNQLSAKVHQVYIPITSVVLMLVSLLGFYVTVMGEIDRKFDPIQSDIRIIREAIVQHHGRLPD